MLLQHFEEVRMASNVVPAMDGQAFIRSLSASSSGSFLLYGNEDYLKDRCLASAKAALAMDESFSMFNEITLDANDASAEDLKVASWVIRQGEPNEWIYFDN